MLSKSVKLMSVAILALLISLGSFTLFGINQDQETKDVEVYFAYPQSKDARDDSPEDIIIDILDDLGDGDRLDIAMYSFTDRDIRLAVRMAALNGVRIKLYLEKTYTYQEEHGAPGLQKICEAGDVTIRVEQPPSYQMHHKFAVVNDQLVITGSYDWTDSADERNWENLLLIRNNEVVKKYSNEFNYMWIVHSNLRMKCGE